MRLFFSVPLPDEAKAKVRKVLDQVRAGGLSLSRAEQLHFTLAFMDEQPESEVRALKEAGAEAVATVPGAFELVLAGAGAFPNPRRPRVLWLSASEGGDRLVELAGALAKSLRDRAFAVEERKFRPHLTLARVKPGGAEAAQAALAALPQTEVARLRVERLELVHSVLRGREGAQHHAIATFPL